MRSVLLAHRLMTHRQADLRALLAQTERTARRLSLLSAAVRCLPLVAGLACLAVAFGAAAGWLRPSALLPALLALLIGCGSRPVGRVLERRIRALETEAAELREKLGR